MTSEVKGLTPLLTDWNFPGMALKTFGSPNKGIDVSAAKHKGAESPSK